jgi:UDP-MurNAc hydroxylase
MFSRGSAPPETTPMEITYVGHAAILVRGGGVSVLMDPWLEDPTYCNSWFHYPPLVHRLEDLTPVDYVYCSHEHPDHFDPPTLRKLPRDQRVLLPEFTSGVLTERFRSVGLTNFVPMPFGETLELAPDFRITCLRSDLIWEDSAVVIESGGVTLFNMNDCKLGDDLLREVGERWQPDIVFVPFSGAIHFPTCYDYTREQRAKLCAQRQKKHLDGFVHRVQLLRAKRAVPFAGNFALLAEDQLWMNEKAQNNINTPDQAIALLREKAPRVEGLQLNPGDRWSLASGIVRHAPPPDFSHKERDIARLAAAVAPRLRALRAAEPAARPTLRTDFARYFGTIAGYHPELCTRIASRIVFEAEGRNGGVWCLDFADGALRVSDYEDGEPWNLRMTLPAGILQRAVDGDICWDEVCISFRVRFRENPEYFNQHFWAMLYNSSRAFLDEYLADPAPKYS